MREFAHLPDCEAFRDLWRQGATQEEIAERFQVSVDTVKSRAQVYGYPRRGKGGRNVTGAMPTRKPEPDPIKTAEKAVSLAGAVGRWSVDQVAAVLRSGGRYAELTALAAKWDVPTVALVGLWHRVRVAV